MSLERKLGLGLIDFINQRKELKFSCKCEGNYGRVLKESAVGGHEDFSGLGTLERVQKCLKKKKVWEQFTTFQIALKFLTGGNGTEQPYTSPKGSGPKHRPPTKHIACCVIVLFCIYISPFSTSQKFFHSINHILTSFVLQGPWECNMCLLICVDWESVSQRYRRFGHSYRILTHPQASFVFYVLEEPRRVVLKSGPYTKHANGRHRLPCHPSVLGPVVRASCYLLGLLAPKLRIHPCLEKFKKL